MEKNGRISVFCFVLASVYCYLVMSDNRISWAIPESFIFAIPVLFLVSAIMAVFSLRKNKKQQTKTKILLALSILGFILTALYFGYIFLLGSAWKN